MAYAVLLASVPDVQVMDFREGRLTELQPQISVRCSHLVPYIIYPKFAELREALRNAVDGGERLRPDLWHPLRVPTWHPAATASRLEAHLRDVWQKTLDDAGRPSDPND